MANTLYENELRKLLEDPNSFSGTPGYQFTRDQALEATKRSNSRQRGSFNALAALMDRGAGLASTEYGNTVDRLGRLVGQEQQFDLGSEANRLTGVRDANALTLGQGRIDLDRELGTRAANTADTRVGNDFTLGMGGLDNSRRAADQNFGLGMYRAGNDFALGSEQNANTAQNNWWNYRTNSEQNANTAAANQNQYNLGVGRNNVDMFNAQTQRGAAQSQDWWNPQRQARMPVTRRVF